MVAEAYQLPQVCNLQPFSFILCLFRLIKISGSIPPLLFSPQLPFHCTSPLDLSPWWAPADSPLLCRCGLAQQLNMILRLISSPFPLTAILCRSSLGCSQRFRLVSHSAFYWASRVHL